MKKIVIITLTTLLLVGMYFADTHAMSYIIQKDKDLYGNLSQHKILPKELGNVSCGPTAAINSFVYLQNKYSDIYNGKLVPDKNNNNIIDEEDMLAIADKLVGSEFMNTKTDNTTYHDNFIYGKRKYLEEVAPGLTSYHAQDYWTWNHHEKYDWVDWTTPTWDFIYNELMKCEDVEILINGGYNHYLTLTSFHWVDTDNDKIIDTSEEAWIDFIDPETGSWGTSDIWHWWDSERGWFIETDYGKKTSWISLAVAESPVPEPTTIILMILGIFGLVCLNLTRNESQQLKS